MAMNNNVVPLPFLPSILLISTICAPLGFACIGFGGCTLLGYPYGGCAPSGYMSPCYGGYCRKHHRLKGSRLMALNESKDEEKGSEFRREDEEEKGEEWGEGGGGGRGGSRMDEWEEHGRGGEGGGRRNGSAEGGGGPKKGAAHGDNFQSLEVSPDVLFLECCQSWALPVSCLVKCSYSNYTANTLHSMFFRADDCPIESASIIHFCASQNQDHTLCCRHNGVPADKCLIFCEQMPQNETRLDLSYVRCFEHFAEMKRCFYDSALRTIDYLEKELEELRKEDDHEKGEEEEWMMIKGGMGGGAGGHLEEDEGHEKGPEGTFAIGRPPIIFVNDRTPKHPQISDEYTAAEDEEEAEEDDGKGKGRIEDEWKMKKDNGRQRRDEDEEEQKERREEEGRKKGRGRNG